MGAGGNVGGQSDRRLVERQLALLVATYHIDPERILQLPRYLLDALLRQLSYVRSLDILDEAVATTLPYLKKDEASRVLDRLLRRVETVIVDPVEIVEYNPQKAAVWFGEHGIQVEENGES